MYNNQTSNENIMTKLPLEAHKRKALTHKVIACLPVQSEYSKIQDSLS